jgi:hypothetical protein
LAAACILIPFLSPFVSCTRQVPPNTQNLGLPLKAVLLGRSPEIYAQLAAVGERLETDEVFVQPGGQLQYLPLAMREGAEEQIKTYVVSDGKESLVSEDPVIPFGIGEKRGQELIPQLLHPVSVDLSGFAGRTVRIVWSFDGSLPGDLYVGNPQIRHARQVPDHRLPEQPEKPKPDILMICSDAHRYDYAFGDLGKELMPLMSEFAKGSTVYESAFSTASWTLPSITSTLTGLYSRFHGTGRVLARIPWDEFDENLAVPGGFLFTTGKGARALASYPDPLVTLPEVLRSGGYATRIVAANPLYFLSGLALDGTDLAVNTGIHSGMMVNDSAYPIIDGSSPDQPLFLLVHYMDVHHWQGWYFNPQNPGVNPGAVPEKLRASYSEAVQHADFVISHLIRRWKKKRDLENTMVVFFSDHGEHLVDPAVGHGGTMREILLRVPLMVKYPASVPAPSVVTEAVSLVDIFPTVLGLAGIDHSESSLPGQMLVPTQGAPLRSRPVFADFQLYGSERSALMMEGAKLVLNIDENSVAFVGSGADEVNDDFGVFDFEKTRRMLSVFASYRQEARDRGSDRLKGRTVDSKEAIKALRSLGYVK